MMKLITVLAILVLAAPAGVAAGPGERFNEFARGFVGDDPDALVRIRPDLEAILPECFRHPMAPGPLRSILARSLPDEVVRELLAGARADAETLAVVTRNLSSRPGIAGLLVELDLVSLLATADSESLVDLAVRSLLDGDSALAAPVLAIPALTLDLADELIDAEFPEGLQFLADVVGGRVRIAEEALALLPLLRPDSYNRRMFRPLGAERIEELARVANSSPDRVLRAFAARLLLYSGVPETFEPAVVAFRHANSCTTEPDEWRSLGKWYGRPVLDPNLPLPARYEAFKGAFQDDQVFTDTDPKGAELHAALLRRFFAEVEEPRLAAAAIRILDWDGPDFLSHSGLRAKPVPSFERMLREFVDGRHQDPPDLARQKSGFARRELARVGTERRRRAEYGEHISSDTGASPVFELLPVKPGLSVNWEGIVSRWIELDPDHLYDPVIQVRLGQLPPNERAAIARSYPRAEILRLLRDAPSRYRQRGRAKFGNDGTGAVNRGRILEFLRTAPDVCEVLLTPGLVKAFPTVNRREAGRLLHLLRPSPERAELLADEEAFAGFITTVIELPQGEEIDLAARVVSGLLGTDRVRERIADWADQELRFRLGPEVDEPWPEVTRELSADLRAPLIRTLREAADPALAFVAARILAMSGRNQDVAALLFAGKDLDIESAGRGHPLAELADRIDSPMRLAYFLMFFRRSEASPRAQREVFARLAEFNWLGRLPAREREIALKVFYEFVTREVPALDGDRPEAFLAALLENTPESMAHRSRTAFAEALPRLPLEASRVRLRHRAAAPR